MTITAYCNAVDAAQSAIEEPRQRTDEEWVQLRQNYRKAKAQLLNFVRLTMEFIGDQPTHAPINAAHFNTLTYYLAWKDLRGGHVHEF